ncbi:MAG: DHH family phosphoesterase [Candidatus Borkfalkiaceae bacterium]|nr:DHH family phosphoesterase [Clostridia bacterium]MDY6223722.1 DHH family phosphoesterase [Christensenellaceae bacterium]
MTDVLRFFKDEERAALTRIAAQLNAAKKIAVITHMRPDGDAFGCALALAAALKKTGRECVVCDESEVPSNLSFMKETEWLVRELPQDADVYVAADCADIARLGAISGDFKNAEKRALTVNIDHHVSNTRFAKENFVRVCSANCMNMLGLIVTLGVTVDKAVANLLMTGLLTDSGGFSHDDVTEETFAAAAYLCAAGADVAALQYTLFKKQPKERALLHGETMSKMKFAFENRFAYIVITREAMERLGADAGMTEGFVDFPLSVDSVEICASVMEVKKRQYKISLRSKSYADVNKLAATFGGGGHVRAAGCMLNGDLHEVLDKLSYAVSQYLR